jgi:KamA family protein
MSTRILTTLRSVPQLDGAAQMRLQPVSDKFAFRSNEYYQSLIDWNDPDDPIRRLVIPIEGELADWGRLDACDEADYTILPGLEYKYRDTAILLVNDVCGAICRFCFRKRVFLDDNTEVVRDVSEGLEFIRAHPEICNVLLSGGDPLLMSGDRLGGILRRLREIDHIGVIRLGTKMPAFDPARIIADHRLRAAIETYGLAEKKVYIAVHYTHPRELTPLSIEALNVLQKSGAVLVNQTPLIRGINDHPVVLRELLERLSCIGVAPYYVFQCRPTLGNKPYTMPLERGYAIFREAQEASNGLARRSRFVMSHSTGKIEVVGQSDGKLYLRYYRAANPENHGRMMVFDSNPAAEWFDEYAEAAALLPVREESHCTA